MPFHDWQFWIVTLLALAGGWMVVRPLLPRRRARGGADASASCPNCPGGSAASTKPRPRRVPLTIEQKRV